MNDSQILAAQPEICRRLRQAEAEHEVQILFACESGSRAWGFASPDSDFDVRFIYAHRQHWYLGFDVERRRDVIEYPIVDEIDCNGWDLRKALYLFTRTNGALFEWLNSPIVYIEQGETAARLRELATRAFNSVALCYHYRHMAKTNAREYVLGERVRLKKYFYVLRPLFAIRYIEAGLGIPPVRFQDLVEMAAPAELHQPIAALLEQKAKSKELGFGEPVPSINAFITAELARHDGNFSGSGRPDLLESDSLRDELNSIFRDAITQQSTAAMQGETR